MNLNHENFPHLHIVINFVITIMMEKDWLMDGWMDDWSKYEQQGLSN